MENYLPILAYFPLCVGKQAIFAGKFFRGKRKTDGFWWKVPTF